MPVKKCPKCGAIWYTDLLKCAFCGIEGQDQVMSESVGHVMDRGKTPAPPDPEAQKAAPAAAAPLDSVPTPSTERAPAPESPKPPEKAVVPASPPEKPAETPRTLPAAPRLPSSAVPLVFGVLGLSAAALVPLTAFGEWNRTASVLLPLGASILVWFAPLAWWTGLRYENRCRELGFRPDFAGRAGRVFGIIITLTLAAQGSMILLKAALRRLRDP